MVEQCNLDSQAARWEATSISSGGQQTSVETPSPDVLPIWSDDDGNNITMNLIGDLPVAHFEFKTGFGLSKLKYYREVMFQVEDALKEHGLNEYYVLVGSQKDYDYAQWMGYEVTGLRVDKTRYEILSKEL